ncbi:MAG: YaaR family protein [Spirochaetales bacterium]|jgi:uncharacterized protein YaaR (DUF327 family)|nr:YaaR family protein [Spirochaetales bacterium]
MDRINPFTGGSPLSRSGKEKKRVKKQKPAKKTFTSILSSREEKIGQVDGVIDTEQHPLEELLDEVHEAGERLKENPTLEFIRDYRKAVKGFLQAVVALSIEVEEHISGVNILKRKRLTLIKIVDEKLERLAVGVLQNQKEQLDILSRLDEIYGLLVDLMR